MIILTDNPAYASDAVVHLRQFEPCVTEKIPIRIRSFANDFFLARDIYSVKTESGSLFNYLFIKRYSEVSQFDQLLEYCSGDDDLPEGIVCFAGSGDKFHGFHQRTWVSLDGNIHLSLALRPRKKIEYAAVAFLIVAANAVTQTINGLERLQAKAGLHWVNDIVINGLKVGGVLCHTQIRAEETERVFLGIGLNVSQTPDLVNDPCVRGATAINRHVDKRNSYRIDEIFWRLVENLETNYANLLDQGYQRLLDYYIENSVLTGKKVAIFSDPRDGLSEKIGEGKVRTINENLELILEDAAAPLRKGRIRLVD